MPGIWYELERVFSEGGVEIGALSLNCHIYRTRDNIYLIDKPASFFVGDAAGRPMDHASSDRKWANNVGIKFLTPEV
jgi:bifunctional polynucleotide phosphatase/kinase